MDEGNSKRDFTGLAMKLLGLLALLVFLAIVYGVLSSNLNLVEQFMGTNGAVSEPNMDGMGMSEGAMGAADAVLAGEAGADIPEDYERTDYAGADAAIEGDMYGENYVAEDDSVDASLGLDEGDGKPIEDGEVVDEPGEAADSGLASAIASGEIPVIGGSVEVTDASSGTGIVESGKVSVEGEEEDSASVSMNGFVGGAVSVGGGWSDDAVG